MGETLLNISHDSIDRQTSEIQNSNTFNLLWKDLLADPDQP